MSRIGGPLMDQEALYYIEKTLACPKDELLVFPKYFLIETVNACNARCVMCGIDFDNKKKAVMSENLFGKIADEIHRYKDHVNKVMLYLDGEPLMDAKIVARIRKMKSAGVKKVNIASNMSLLNKDKATEIINAGIDEIYITLDSLKKDVYEAIRKGLVFETVYNNIINFIELRNRLNPDLVIRVQMVLQETNLGEAGNFTAHWTSLLGSHDQIVVQKAHNWGSTVDLMKFGDEDKINYVPCIALWGTMCIHVNGDVGLCCMDTNTIYPLGSVVTQSIAEIWHSDAMNRIRDKHLRGMRDAVKLCDGCTVWRDSKHYMEHVLGVR